MANGNGNLREAAIENLERELAGFKPPEDLPALVGETGGAIERAAGVTASAIRESCASAMGLAQALEEEGNRLAEKIMDASRRHARMVSEFTLAANELNSFMQRERARFEDVTNKQG